VNPITGLKNIIRTIITEALIKAKEEKKLILDTIPEFVVEVPKEKNHGDFACNVAMLLARTERKPPKEIAGIIIACIETEKIAEIEKIETSLIASFNFALFPLVVRH